MRLKSLEIQGFKSFPDKTKLTFVDGLTAVVGPNGSGKSNISDAVRWVLGEQSTKTLRGNKMEDVIFTGTQTRKALGFCEVSLTIDNFGRELPIESDDLIITRKYYRSGESEYQINKQNVRLKDIHELLMDTGLGRDGYSMVGQGRIAEIVGAKSNERRDIFEEAAGISKYRYRKNEAEKRLDLAQENLLRLKDILLELEARVEPLRVQSEKAKKYLSLSEEKRLIEVSLWVATLEDSKDKLREQEYKLTALRQSHQDMTEQIERIEKNLEEVYTKTQQCAVAIDEQRSRRQQLEEQSAGMEQQKAVLQNDIFHNAESIARIHTEIDEITGSAENMNQELALKQQAFEQEQERLSQLEMECSQVDEELSGLSGQTESMSSDIEQQNALLVSNNIKITQDTVALSGMDSTKQELIQRAQTVAVTQEQKRQQYTELLEEKNNCSVVLKQCEEESQRLENMLKGYELKLGSVRNKKDSIKHRLDEQKLLLHQKENNVKLITELEQNMEGFAFSVKTVITEGQKGALRGIHGTVAQLISVKSEYALAIETALAGAMQNIVVENEDNAKRAIYELKEKKAGRATFLPISTIHASRLNENGLENCDGFVGIGCDLITFDEKYTEIIRSLLGRVIVAQDLDDATAISKRYSYKYRVVTLDGQVVNAGGSLTGGSSGKSTGILSRRFEIEKLRGQIKELSEEISAITAQLEEITAQESAAVAYISGLRAELSVLSEDKIRYTAEQKRLELSCGELNEQLDMLEREQQDSLRRRQELDEKITVLKQALDENMRQKEQSEQALEALSGGRNQVVQRVDELSQRSTQLRFDMLSVRKDMDNILHSMEQLGQQKSGVSEKLNAMMSQIAELESKNADITAQIASIDQNRTDIGRQVEDCDKAVTAAIESRQTLEQSVTLIRAEERSCLEQREKLTGELTRVEERKISVQTEYDNIIFRLLNEYELNRSEAYEIATKLEDIGAAQRKLNDLKNKIKALGSINVEAIDEYVEVSSRYTFLKEQIEDVEKSKDELSRLIYELTLQMRELFCHSFEEINQHFSRIFVELFGGGKASLKLTEPDNVLESGIEIFVQPPGKIIKNLASLSGGEQAFVAIAIYFAILKVKPAPFCILDEIEAALDDVNVNKYASYLRSMSGKTQFILITHRRGSMEEADVLYGVTMQEEGVSKLLELQVSEVESKLGMKNQ